MEVTARAIIIENDKLMVFYRERVVNNERICYFSLPGGHVEKEEMARDTVVRELKEELNIDILVDYEVGSINVDNKLERYFVCHRVSGEPILGGEELLRNSSDNYYEFRYLPIDELDNSGIRAYELIKKVL